MNKKQKGYAGESIAAEFLKNNSHTIIEKNFYSKCGEIDIISVIKDNIVFTEVKYRNDDLVSALYSINKKKQTNIIRTALLYIKSHIQYQKYQMRFDVISIIKDNSGKINIEHIPNAFRQ